MNLHSRKKTLRLFRLFSLAFVLFIITLYRTQIQQHTDLSSLASKNCTRHKPINPLRGCIFDRTGIPLTQNRFSFRAVYMPGAQSDSTTLAIIKKCIVNHTTNEPLAQKIQKKKFFTIKSHLSTEEIVCLKKHKHYSANIDIERHIVRHHPQGPILTRVLGQTGFPSAKDLGTKKALSRYIRQPMSLAGQSGCELVYNDLLAGEYGNKIIKVDALGNFIEDIAVQPPKNGQHLQTTLNAPLQNYAEALLSSVRAAHAVILHIPTGQVLAMVSHDEKDSSALVASNKVISGAFPPGSIFKIVTVLAALQNGLASFTTTCRGSFTLGNHTLHCWKRDGHGLTDLSQALYKSCNVFFYQLALKLGSAKILETAKQLHLGEKTNIDLSSENAGTLPAHNTKTFEPHKPWYAADTAILGIGQGRIALTPLQLTHALASIIRGYVVPPRINYNAPSSKKEPLKIPLPQRKKLQAMLHKCMNHPEATGFTATQNLTLQNSISGKTSTAQIVKLTKGIQQKELPWELRSHSIFLGFAPQDKPLIAVTVIGEHEMWGAGFAAHAALKLCHYALNLHKKHVLLHTKSPPATHTRVPQKDISL